LARELLERHPEYRNNAMAADAAHLSQ
jgi:hypothetical protein